MPTPRPDVTAAVHAVAGAALAATLTGATTTEARRDAAVSPWLTPALAARLARSRNTWQLAALAGNRACPPPLLASLTAHAAFEVSGRALTNPACPFAAVAANNAEHLILAHPHCPADRLEAALDDHLREYAWAHPNLPTHHLAHLAATLTGTGTWKLLENPALTTAQGEAVLARLEDGPHHRVAVWDWAKHPAAAPAWLATTAELAFDDHDQGTMARIAANPATPASTLADIVARHAHRDYALANPSCPAAAMLEQLTRTPEADPRVSAYGYADRARTIALNPGATPAVLDRLTVAHLGSGDGRYRFALAHARSGDAARAVLALAPTWTASLADLLAAAAAVTG